MFSWGDINIENYTIAQVKTQLNLSSYIISQTNSGETIYCNPDYSQILSGTNNEGIFSYNTLFPTNSQPEITGGEENTYSLFWKMSDSNIAVADQFTNIVINGTDYESPSPIDLQDTAGIKAFIVATLADIQVLYSSVFVNYTLANVNNNYSVLVVTIANCTATITDFHILKNGVTPDSNTFAVINQTGVIVPSSLGYTCYYSYVDNNTGINDMITGFTFDGSPVVLPSPIAVTQIPITLLEIERAILSALGTIGKTCSDVDVNFNPAQANGRNSTLSIVVLNSNAVIDSIEMDIDSGTIVSEPFIVI